MQNTKIWILSNGVLLSDHRANKIPMPAIDTGVSVKDFLQMPASFWMLDADGRTMTINAEGADVCGFKSVQDAVGKSLIDVSKKENAIQLIGNCHSVIQAKAPQIYDETNILIFASMVCSNNFSR